jgi:hypothetical protein
MTPLFEMSLPQHRCLTLLLSRSQKLAGRLADCQPVATVDDIRALIVGLPLPATRPERMMAGAILSHVIVRIARLAGVEQHSAVGRGLQLLALADNDDCDWRVPAAIAIESCVRALTERSATPVC